MGRRLNQKDIIDTYRRVIIRMLYRDWNFSCADIGRIFRISRQRVWQIVKEKKLNKKCKIAGK